MMLGHSTFLLIVCVLILFRIMHHKVYFYAMWLYCYTTCYGCFEYNRVDCDPLLVDWFGSSSSFFFMLTWRYLLCLHVLEIRLWSSSFFFLDWFGSSSSFFFMLTWRYLLCRHVVELWFWSSSFFFLHSFGGGCVRFEKSYCICVEMSFTIFIVLEISRFYFSLLRGASFRLLILHQESVET